MAKIKTVTEGTIAHTTVTLIRQGLSNTDILKRIQAKHTGCNTSMACVAWYRAKMRKGLYGDKPNSVPTSLVATITAAQKVQAEADKAAAGTHKK